MEVIRNILGCTVGHIQPVGAWRNSFHPTRFVIVFHFTLPALLFALNGCCSCSWRNSFHPTRFVIVRHFTLPRAPATAVALWACAWRGLSFLTLRHLLTLPCRGQGSRGFRCAFRVRPDRSVVSFVGPSDYSAPCAGCGCWMCVCQARPNLFGVGPVRAPLAVVSFSD